MELVLKYNMPDYANAPTLALNGVPPSETPAVTAFIYWKWDDEQGMDWQMLGETKTGGTWEGSFNNPDNRPVRLAVIGQALDGNLSGEGDFSNADQIVVTATASRDAAETLLPASESLDALDIVNVWDDGGTPKVRKADATDDTKPAHGFVVESVTGDSFGPGDSVRVFYTGNILRGLVGLVPNQPYFLSETAGQITATPVTGTGKILQVVGYAISTTDLMFEPEETIKRA